MWKNTDTTHCLQITIPIIQAPMAGGITTPEMVAACANAGGLGSLAAGYLKPADLREQIVRTRALTQHHFAINLFVPGKFHATSAQIERAKNRIISVSKELHYDIPEFYPPYVPSFDEQIQIVLNENSPIISFTFGIPEKHWLVELKKRKIILIGTATTYDEAKLLAENGFDFIVAQGSEAGGHRGTFLGKVKDALIKGEVLTKEIKSKIKTPVIAAGGIMNAEKIVAALKLDAALVQLGTAFLCCHESGIHPAYKKILLARDRNTLLTRAFTGKYARGISNQFIIRMQDHEEDVLDYPIQHALTRSMRSEAAYENNAEFMSMWAGEGAHLCREGSMQEIMQAFKEDIDTLLSSQ